MKRANVFLPWLVVSFETRVISGLLISTLTWLVDVRTGGGTSYRSVYWCLQGLLQETIPECQSSRISTILRIHSPYPHRTWQDAWPKPTTLRSVHVYVSCFMEAVHISVHGISSVLEKPGDSELHKSLLFSPWQANHAAYWYAISVTWLSHTSTTCFPQAFYLYL